MSERREERDSTVERNEAAIRSANEERRRLREERSESERVTSRARRQLDRLINRNGSTTAP